MLDIHVFLHCTTPQRWIETALTKQDILLLDHAHCEKKAASTALSLIYRYPEYHQLMITMSRLAREELRHFEQVLKLMQKREIKFQHLSPCRYAGELFQHIHNHEPDRLIDTLIIGAYIEARSCERFASLAPFLDEELRTFYENLLESESRHFNHYLELAFMLSPYDISERITFFGKIEQSFIETPDEVFRFHSGA